MGIHIIRYNARLTFYNCNYRSKKRDVEPSGESMSLPTNDGPVIELDAFLKSIERFVFLLLITSTCDVSLPSDVGMVNECVQYIATESLGEYEKLDRNKRYKHGEMISCIEQKLPKFIHYFGDDDIFCVNTSLIPIGFEKYSHGIPAINFLSIDRRLREFGINCEFIQSNCIERDIVTQCLKRCELRGGICGERPAFVIGCGASLDELGIRVEEIHKFGFTIGVNAWVGTYGQIDPPFDVYIANDGFKLLDELTPPAYARFRELLTSDRLKIVTGVETLFERECEIGANTYTFWNQAMFDVEPLPIRPTGLGTIVRCATELCLYLGFKKIYLLGFDLVNNGGYTKRVHHVLKDKMKSQEKSYIKSSNKGRHESCWRNLVNLANAYDRSIVSVSSLGKPGGWEWFPMEGIGDVGGRNFSHFRRGGPPDNVAPPDLCLETI